MSTIVTDTLQGKTSATSITLPTTTNIGATPLVSASANSMTIRGEGSATTNIQQGLTKTWINHFEGTSINDSFNCTSLTDNGTGYHNHSFVNNHGNKNYASSASVIGDSSTQTQAYTYCFIGGANNTSNSVHATNSIRYSIIHHAGSIYDQQMTQIMTVGDLA